MLPVAGTGSPTTRRSVAPLLWGSVGVLTFSLTLPLTRAALVGFDPLVVALGRSAIAGLLALPLLLLTRQPRPTRAQWRHIAVVAACITVGFPLLSSWALARVPASHGAVFLALLPVATAILSLRHTRERPGRLFWVAASAGALVVMVYAVLARGFDGVHGADLLLVGAMLCGALSYAEGSVVTPHLGSWQVTCWALALALPVLGPIVLADLLVTGPHAPASAWAALLWMAFVGMIGGFVAWYHALRTGGVARISQLQLVQPLLAIAWSSVLLGESVPVSLVVAGVLTVACVAVAQRARA
ncbi:membrane protein [Cellulomonas soli]|uniref:Membrane protein n=1 Tax=Cellulomonas soli TaxID=931535 RepID=A0A512PDY4_9CELL|nr:membrane protein [Cellulomonas soli]